ncbi:hypothetical protein ACFL1B_00350 [Nanoarchaeota archaeon]
MATKLTTDEKKAIDTFVFQAARGRYDLTQENWDNVEFLFRGTFKRKPILERFDEMGIDYQVTGADLLCIRRPVLVQTGSENNRREDWLRHENFYRLALEDFMKRQGKTREDLPKEFQVALHDGTQIQKYDITQEDGRKNLDRLLRSIEPDNLDDASRNLQELFKYCWHSPDALDTRDYEYLAMTLAIEGEMETVFGRKELTAKFLKEKGYDFEEYSGSSRHNRGMRWKEVPENMLANPKLQLNIRFAPNIFETCEAEYSNDNLIEGFDPIPRVSKAMLKDKHPGNSTLRLDERLCTFELQGFDRLRCYGNEQRGSEVFYALAKNRVETTKR